MKEKLETLYKYVSDLEKRINKLENKDSENILTIILIRPFKKSKEYIFKKFDIETIRKHFSVQIVYSFITKGNKNIYGEICNIMDIKYLILSDTEEKLREDVINMCNSA